MTFDPIRTLVYRISFSVPVEKALVPKGPVSFLLVDLKKLGDQREIPSAVQFFHQQNL